MKGAVFTANLHFRPGDYLIQADEIIQSFVYGYAHWKEKNKLEVVFHEDGSIRNMSHSGNKLIRGMTLLTMRHAIEEKFKTWHTKEDAKMVQSLYELSKTDLAKPNINIVNIRWHNADISFVDFVLNGVEDIVFILWRSKSHSERPDNIHLCEHQKTYRQYVIQRLFGEHEDGIFKAAATHKSLRLKDLF